MSIVPACLAQPPGAAARPDSPDGGTASVSLPDATAFVDYDLAYSRRLGEPGTLAAVTSHGLRLGRLLLYNELAAWESAGRAAFLRGDSGLALDWDRRRGRLVIGDMASRTSPSLGEQVRLLGIGIQSGGLRSTSLAAAPFRAFAGATSAGGTVDVYVDGMHVHHAGVRPGRSPLRNIARFAGLRPVEVVMRDAAGREVRAIRSGFAADRLLPAGASEYEYMAGNARLDTAGGGYGDLALVASHRTALTDKLTLGGYFDRIGGDFSGTVGVGARLDDLGAVSGEFGMAREDTAPMATSAAIRYTHSVGPLSLTLGYLRADSAYLSDEEGAWGGSPANLVEDVGAKLSYSLPMIGTFTLTSTRSTYEGAAPQTLTTLSYSFEREGRWRLDWTLAHRSRTPEATDASGWLAGLNLTVALDEPGTGTSAPTFGWMAQARRALGTGPAGAHAQDAHLPTLATDALASAHRFDTPAGILYGRVDAGDVTVSAPPAWQLGWSGSVLGARGVWAPRKPDNGI